MTTQCVFEISSPFQLMEGNTAALKKKKKVSDMVLVSPNKVTFFCQHYFIITQKG